MGSVSWMDAWVLLWWAETQEIIKNNKDGLILETMMNKGKANGIKKKGGWLDTLNFVIYG